MSNYSDVIGLINAQIKTNGLKAITGAKLNGVLLEMVEELGTGYQYKGVATPATDPGTPDENVFYIATTPGNYTNFGGLAISDGEVAIFKGTGSTWTKEVTGAATAAQVSQLDQEVNGTQQETISVIALGVYAHTPFPNGLVLPAGTIIQSISTNITCYPVNLDDTLDTTVNLASVTKPYTTTKPYCGIAPYESGTISLTYGVETLGLEERVQNIENAQYRKQIFVKKTDSQNTIFEKFLAAWNAGETDIIFEKSTYTLDSVYDTIREVLHTNWTVGLPIGKGCKYFFNGSTIISNPPTSDYFSGSRNILDSQAQGGNYEIYDVILINNGGRYCVHDEAQSSTIPYLHKYINVSMKYVYDEYSGDGGCKAFGCGCGYNAELLFENCFFENVGSYQQEETAQSALAIHGPTYPSPAIEPATLKLTILTSRIKGPELAINTYDKLKDTLLYKFIGNYWDHSYSGDLFTEIIAYNNVTSL